VIHYRAYRNPDSPAVVEAWNACFSGRRVVPVRLTTVLEYFTFAKPYFDPQGLILALDDDKPIGLVHAGFGPAADGQAIDPATGVICALGVAPSHRRQGIGGELLRRAEDYLKQLGATELFAGPLAPRNPFTFGLYGGCNSPGFLASDVMARPFFEKYGYRLSASAGLFQRPLARAYLPPDPRFATIRQSYDVIATAYHGAGWWRECVMGPIEAVEYRVQQKQQGAVVARCVLWDMEPFAPVWGESCVGMLELTVLPEHRRQGLAKYLLSQILRHLRDQPFHLFEAMADPNDAAAMGLLRGLEFQQVEVGHAYRR
jgi:ribosomal protein S18 acetylase RimI-like enzyme